MDRSIRKRVTGAPPHTRGWTRDPASLSRRVEGSPAHAGMDPLRGRSDLGGAGLPRTRGDGPFLRHAPAGTATAPPHTRGWTRHATSLFIGVCGSPAHAGMDLAVAVGGGGVNGLPRTRGDGPHASDLLTPIPWAPPHTRGWTRPRADRVPDGRGSPAHAGMDLRQADNERQTSRLPRTRGDGPDGGLLMRCASPAPPHTRGWTPLLARNAHIRPQLFGMQVQILPNSRTYR